MVLHLKKIIKEEGDMDTIQFSDGKQISMDGKIQRKLTNLRYRLKKGGYQVNDEVKIVVLPKKEEQRSSRREREILKFGYDLQNNLFKNE